MTQFKPSLIKLALISSGLAFASAPAVAQQQDSAQPDDDMVEVIQVSGIRSSLQRAQAIKMDSSSIVEALSAEDIGKLPDTSIAESLARLPGLAGERRNGRTSGISVRGFNENYVGTTLNGRELLGMGDNRGVEFDLYPTEIISNIVVYKTPEAGMTTQNIGGSIDLQTVKPLFAESTLTVNGTYEKNAEDSANPDFDNDGHRVSVNFVDQFADDTLGVAITAATMESPRQERQFRGWGYPTVDLESDKLSIADGVNVPEDTAILGGHDSFARSAMMERDSLAAVIQWRPSEKLDIQFDALYIDFVENDARRGLEEEGAVWGPSDFTVTGVDNGLVTSYTTEGVYSIIRNDVREQDAELTTFGLNAEYLLNDDWTLTADISTGQVDKTITDVESYSGVGRAGTEGRPLTSRTWEMTDEGVMFSDHPTNDTIDLTDPSLIRLAGPQAWGAPIVGADAQDGFVNKPEFEETLSSYRFDLEGYVDWGIVTGLEAGIIYSDREKSKDNNGAYLTGPAYPGDDEIPDVLGVVPLDFIGINGVLAYDALGLYNSGYYSTTDAELVQADRLGDTYTVNEELTTLYTKLKLDTEVSGIYIRGNVGLQVVHADQQSSGFSTTLNRSGRVDSVAVSGGTDYTDVLPTLNLAAEFTDNQFVRLGLSKVLTRPRMDDMRPNTQVTFSFNDNQILSNDIDNGPWSGSSGNPDLKPYEANQLDLAYENYFADSGYVAVSFFYKDIKNWHRSNSALADFSDDYIPEIHQTSEGEAPVLFEGEVSRPTDGYEGFVRGWEVQGSLPGDMIHDSLEGFGVFASATFLDGYADPAPGTEETRIPGLSDENYSMTFFYEKSGFEFRVSATKRSDYLTETRGVSLALSDSTNEGGTFVDAQIGYDFSESGIESLDGLRVTLQGQNLTDENDLQTSGADGRQIITYQSYGANYLLAFNYTF
ncbi:TonB-dependent receptor [Alteromonas halophila]|uniref:TonB-dependent receptor n=1 Tax=Alteromonas halophila TaxID=516698 RepID=A0A918MYE7_9ALTE|nr:TonB-dependent receptor [Alteromonas halophila]GGW88035.1 TonB-dependent receptor [Alteromonas halophila]